MCFGTCPSYKLVIYENGLVVYEGRDFVGTMGVRTSNIGENKVQQLAAELENSNYFSFQDSYEEYMVTDHPSAITYVKIGNKEKKISHYYGDFNAPRELYELEQRIDEVGKSRRWVEACTIRYSYFCKGNPFFWIVTTFPLALAVWIALPYIKRRNVFVGVIRGQGVIVLLWLIVVAITKRVEVYSFDSVQLYSLTGLIEVFLFLIIGLFLAWRYSRQAKLNL